MDRRAFLLSAAGLAAVPGLPAGVGAPEAPPAGASPVGTSFDDWRRGFVERASAAGFARDQVLQVLDPLTPDPAVLANDQRQPELSRPIGDYIQGLISRGRVEQAQAREAALGATLASISNRSGVPSEILLSIWAVESSFGQNQGGFDVIRSLATLAAQGRRRDFAETQLLACLRIVFSGEASRDQLKGSWAGAMGQTQFTPADYLAWAVDADGDGRRDIWGSSADALGSAANFLAHKAAWRPGQGWAREVIAPVGFDYAVTEGPWKPAGEWAALGVRPAGSMDWNACEAAEAMQLIAPAGWTGPVFLILPNHMAIRAYNNSTSYALGVGLLADRIAGAPPLQRAWPADQPLSLADRMAAQGALNQLGFAAGVPDGVIGLRTRAAARQWQKARGLPSDGYLSYALIQRLKAEAAAAAAPSLTPAPVEPFAGGA